MTPAQLHAIGRAKFGTLVGAVRSEQWSNPTPCSEWDVRALVRHMVNEQLWVPELLRGATIAEVGTRFDGDVLGDDPVAAWVRASAAAQAAIEAHDLTGTVHVSWGVIPASEYAGQLLTDLAVHGWDLARGISVDDTIDSRLVSALLPVLEKEKASLAASGVFGTPVAVAAGASPQTRLLGLLGRQGMFSSR